MAIETQCVTLRRRWGGYLESIAAGKFLGWSSVGPKGGSPFWSSSWSAVDQRKRTVNTAL